MIAVGAIHTVGTIGYALLTLPAERLTHSPPTPETMAAMWSVFAGAFLMLCGLLARIVETRDGGIPQWFGWTFAAVSLPGAIMMPLTGFTLLTAMGVFSALKARKRLRS